MTKALCLNCGNLKYGAFCACRCQAQSSGNIGLDIAFIDRFYDVETLKGFGAVIKAIRSATTDPAARRAAFLEYVSEHHPSILTVDLEPELKAKVTEILRGLTLPTVAVREPPPRRQQRSETDRFEIPKFI